MKWDMTKVVEEIVTQCKETEEEFIFETIQPHCENILQMKINKEELNRIILRGVRPKGKWIEVDVHNFYATLKCSVCDRVIEPYFNFGEYSYEDIKTFYPYCHCGAEMSGGADE